VIFYVDNFSKYLEISSNVRSFRNENQKRFVISLSGHGRQLQPAIKHQNTKVLNHQPIKQTKSNVLPSHRPVIVVNG